MKKKNSLVSVIVPIFNAEKEIEKCIQSILMQTYEDTEIILINDGSTDNSGKICEKYVNKSDKIKYINNENNGVSKTRNIGIKEALGEYICFVDSDDFIDKTYIEQLINYTENKTLAMCKIIRFYDEHTITNIIKNKEVNYYVSSDFLQLYKLRTDK